jgi:cation-transporting P-type ATPase E
MLSLIIHRYRQHQPGMRQTKRAMRRKTNDPSSFAPSMHPTEPISMLQGLSEGEVLERRANGQGNVVPRKTSRSSFQIINENIFTSVNMILFGLGVALILLGQISAALISVSVVFLNTLVGIMQEIRARHALDHIALLTCTMATVMREGHEQRLDTSEIVGGDLLVLRPGDQVVVDGPIVEGGCIEVDEALLTGESASISKHAGDWLFSGSFCLSGRAFYQAEKVGAQSTAYQLTVGARAFRRMSTPLQRQIQLLIQVMLLVAIFCEVLLAMNAWLHALPSVQDVEMAVVIIGIVPNGLLLAISVAYALGALRLVGKGALVQQANAVESLSNVDVLCLDKTGTLTTNTFLLDALVPFGCEESAVRQALGNYVASLSVGNSTSAAIGAACQGHALSVREEVPFSSARKWSALALDDALQRGVYVLGAPEILAPFLCSDHELGMRVEAEAVRGRRVVVFAFCPNIVSLYGPDGEPRLPADLLPLGVLSLSNTLRTAVQEALAGFAQAGIQLKIISGDHPATVAALAQQAGLDGSSAVVSGETLADMPDAQLALVAEETTIFGRVTPQQKARLIQALRSRSHYVAMIGDGVNDVFALKQADLGIAMQRGSAAARGVADLVLLGDSFAALPAVFREGQRIRNGMHTIIQLFLIRIFYATILLVATMTLGGFPFTPQQNAILTFLTEAVPALALAAWARPGALPGRSLRRSLTQVVLPAALWISLAGLGVYFVERATSQFLDAQSALTTFVVLCGVGLIPLLASPIKTRIGSNAFTGDWRPTLLALGLLGGYGMVLAIAPLRTLFDLLPLGRSDEALIGGTALAWGFGLPWIWRTRLLERLLQGERR